MMRCAFLIVPVPLCHCCGGESNVMVQAAYSQHITHIMICQLASYSIDYRLEQENHYLQRSDRHNGDWLRTLAGPGQLCGYVVFPELEQQCQALLREGGSATSSQSGWWCGAFVLVNAFGCVTNRQIR